MKFKKIIIAILSFSTLVTQAQETAKETTTADFRLSANYNTNLNYFGRTDSLQSSGFFPMAELWVNNSFYVNAAPIFVNNNLQSFDYAGTIATLGFQHVSDKLITHAFFMKPLYTEETKLVQSALKAQTGLSLTALNKILNVTVGADLKFSDKTDLGATFGLDHLIQILGKNNLSIIIDPGFYAYAGTQNFTRTYQEKKRNLFLLPSTNEVTENEQRFNILAFEFAVPLIITKEKWQFVTTPSYIMPKNLIKVEGRPDLSETGENAFYTTFSLKYTF
ncbi:MAG: hypothetical protein ACR2KB_13080 [Chitinophagaceae bacterium]